MNRIDRLVAILIHLQGRRVTRAEEIAEEFATSIRTVYRDIAALAEAGVPIVGEAGVGYSIMRGYHLPPVHFTTEEATALITANILVDRQELSRNAYNIWLRNCCVRGSRGLEKNSDGLPCSTTMPRSVK